MQIVIEKTSSRAVYQQIIDQVRRDVALGRVKEKEKLPTVRELAVQLAINPNTIAKAYRQLEQEGIITTRPGSGAFVSSMESHLSGTVRKKIIIKQLERAVVDAFHMQIDKVTLSRWFNDIIVRFNLPDKKGKSNG